MDVETQQNELVSENVRECYRGNEDRIYGFPSVCLSVCLCATNVGEFVTLETRQGTDEARTQRLT